MKTKQEIIAWAKARMEKSPEERYKETERVDYELFKDECEADYIVSQADATPETVKLTVRTGRMRRPVTIILTHGMVSAIE